MRLAANRNLRDGPGEIQDRQARRGAIQDKDIDKDIPTFIDLHIVGKRGSRRDEVCNFHRAFPQLVLAVPLPLGAFNSALPRGRG
jgi:hypothetical protein